MPTKIAWTDESWNPIAGCSKCSPGCKNCYAERMAHRQRHICLTTNRNPQYLGKTDDDGHWTGEVECCDWMLDIPSYWKKSRRIFVCSMSDLFHPKVPEGFIIDVFDVIAHAAAAGHILQVLTKRVKRMAEIVGDYCAWVKNQPNVHLGISISTQAEADEKIPILLQIPAAIRWLSVEPMLEGIDLALDYGIKQDCTGEIEPKYLDWIVYGCESGPKRRPFELDWVRDGIRQCIPENISVFVKQLSINGKVSHDIKQFPKDLQFQEYPSRNALRKV